METGAGIELHQRREEQLSRNGEFEENTRRVASEMAAEYIVLDSVH